MQDELGSIWIKSARVADERESFLAASLCQRRAAAAHVLYFPPLSTYTSHWEKLT